MIVGVIAIVVFFAKNEAVFIVGNLQKLHVPMVGIYHQMKIGLCYEIM